VDFYAPPQSKVPVYIIDFKDDSASKTVDTVANIEKCKLVNGTW
jgi:hypothetical protein